MTDPERLLHDLGPSLARELLRAGADEAPAREAVEKTLLTVGAMALTLGAAGAASAATASAATAAAGSASAAGAAGGASAAVATSAGAAIGVGTTVKLFAVGAIVGVAASGVTWTVSRSTSPAHESRAASATPQRAPKEAPVVHAAPPPEPMDPANSELNAPVPEASAEPAPPSAKAFPLDEASQAPPLAAEVALVDRAHRALAGGDAQGAISALSGYENRFDRPRLLPEVLALRMEAAQRLGDGSAARLWAGRLVGGFPRSAQAARARELLAR